MNIPSVNNKTNNQVSHQKSSNTSQTSKADSIKLESLKQSDRVDITSVAKEITKAFESSKSPSPINEERVNAVKKALKEGNYPIDAQRIAKKMIQMEKQFNNSR